MNDNINNSKTRKQLLSAERIAKVREIFEQHQIFSPRLRQRYLDLSEEQREAFYVYVLSDAAPKKSILAPLKTFESAFFGSYRSWDEAREALMRLFGWERSLADADIRDEFDQPLNSLLRWDEEAVRERLEEALCIVELDSGAIVIFHW